MYFPTTHFGTQIGASPDMLEQSMQEQLWVSHLLNRIVFAFFIETDLTAARDRVGRKGKQQENTHTHAHTETEFSEFCC